MLSSDEIRLLRYSRQMKQEAISKKMGITKQRYSKLENKNNLRQERINEILEVLGYTLKTARNYLDNIPPLVSTSILFIKGFT